MRHLCLLCKNITSKFHHTSLQIIIHFVFGSGGGGGGRIASKVRNTARFEFLKSYQQLANSSDNFFPAI